jgi:aspartate racemase
VKNESLLTVGVLGGMGPAATVDFMARVIALTPGDSDQDHVRLIVDQNPRIPNRQDALLRDGEHPGEVLAEMARGLEDQDCDFLVMPCNTAHAFQKDIRAAVKIPLVSMIDATLDAAKAAKCVGVMATVACLRANVYQSSLESRNITHVLPSREEAENLTRLVFEIKRGNKGELSRAAVARLARSLVARGADVIVSACTEIPLVFGARDLDVPLLSSTDELAKLTIALARGDKALPNK